MRKLKLAVLLPTIQCIIAAILLQCKYRAPVPRGSELYVPTVWLICRGLNAPALLFWVLAHYLFSWETMSTWVSRSRSIFGFYADDIFFLVGVIVVWYFVGLAMDRRRTESTVGKGVTTIVCSLLLALGVLLFALGLHDLGPGRPENIDPPVGAFLTLMWSISLIFLSGRGIVRVIRRAFRRSV